MVLGLGFSQSHPWQQWRRRGSSKGEVDNINEKKGDTQKRPGWVGCGGCGGGHRGHLMRRERRLKKKKTGWRRKIRGRSDIKAHFKKIENQVGL